MSDDLLSYNGFYDKKIGGIREVIGYLRAPVWISLVGAAHPTGPASVFLEEWGGHTL